MELEIIRQCLLGHNPGAEEELVQEGGVEGVTGLLNSRDASIVEGAGLVLGCLCLPFEGKRAAVEAGAVVTLVKLLAEREPGSNVQIVALSALMAICIEIEAKKGFRECDGEAHLMRALESGDERVLLPSLQLLVACAEHPPSREALQPCRKRISHLCYHNLESVRRHAILACRSLDFRQHHVQWEPLRSDESPECS